MAMAAGQRGGKGVGKQQAKGGEEELVVVEAAVDGCLLYTEMSSGAAAAAAHLAGDSDLSKGLEREAAARTI